MAERRSDRGGRVTVDSSSTGLELVPGNWSLLFPVGGGSRPRHALIGSVDPDWLRTLVLLDRWVVLARPNVAFTFWRVILVWGPLAGSNI